MQSVPAIALSGMAAAQASLRTSSHNIANVNTDGFRRHSVVQSAAAGGGVTVTPTRATQVASLERDLVGQLEAKNAFLANLAVFRASDRMAGSLLDAVG